MKRIINFIKGFSKSLNDNFNTKIELICVNCGKMCTVKESLERDYSNDSCPYCGSSELLHNLQELK